MFMVPTAILPLWLLAAWSFGLFGGGLYLLREWYERSRLFDPARDGGTVFRPDFGWNADTAFLLGGLLLLLSALAGGFVVRPLLRALMRRSPEDHVDDVAAPRPKGRMERLERQDGSKIQVESFGPEDGPPVVLSHGWGDNRREWEYLRRDLGESGHRLIVWDLPGLGESDEPPGKDYRMENFAADLDLVLRGTCGSRPAVLAGHSTGVMATLTFCRLFPEAMGARVAGLILAHGTYINPVRTARGAALFTALEKPLLVPLLYLTIALSPLLRLANWMSYHNGAAHVNALVSGFCGTQSFEQVDFSARFMLQAPPAVTARGMLGMLRFDETQTLKNVAVPVMIVAGDRDMTCVPEASERMARDIPDARLETLSPANHMGLIEHSPRFAGMVRPFLKSCFKKRGGAKAAKAR